MKNTLLLTLALGVASALPLKAVDVYITGSTAFRTQVFNACKNLFQPGFQIGFGDAAHGGNGKLANNDTAWVMSGTATNGLSFANSPLSIHGLFTGSIQGMQAEENSQQLGFPLAVGTANTSTGTTYVTNSPTITFADVATASTATFDVNNTGGAFNEEQVAVQPFVFVKSAAGGNVMSSITNVTWEQIKYAISKGRVPFSVWSGKSSDTNNFVYLLNRTLDSGTLVSTEEEVSFPYAQNFPIFNYDHAATQFYPATNSLFATVGTTGVGVIGTAGTGFNNANLNWGPGYIGGSDIAAALGFTDSQNQSIAYLSVNDAKAVTGVNWQEVMAFNGVWPTAAGPGISGNTGTNDFSPVVMGNYPFWNYEVVVYPTGTPASGGITQTALGNQTASGSFLGVLDHQTKLSGGTPLPGSIENEIENSKVAGATAIRLSDMTASRQTVGGIVFPIPAAN
jgi:hypothetical protein